MGNIPILTLSLISTGTVAAYRMVTAAGAQAGAAANTAGVSLYAGVAGEVLAVDALGTGIAEAGAAVAVGAALSTDSSGRVITATDGPVVARALQAAAAAGQKIEVILIPN